eukprot:2946661-Pleurochrysis_carterae.AAC.1
MCLSWQNIDPSYEYTLRHFELLWRRYGAPVIVFDLVRQTEKKARESLLGAALANALNALQVLTRALAGERERMGER